MDNTNKLKVIKPRKDCREGKKPKRFLLKSLLIKLSVVVVAIVVVFTLNCVPGTTTPESSTPATTVTTIVTFPDANLEAAIRDAIGKPTGSITTTDLEDLTQLIANAKGIIDLTGLEYCTNLTFLNLYDNEISDISPLAPLTNLTNLILGFNQISDISPLASLTNLTSLHLSRNPISDISPLASLTNLTVLFLSSNEISDISPLVNNSGLGAGDEVQLWGNPLNEISINDYIPQLQARGVNVTY